MKKILTTLAALLVVFSLVFVFASCGKGGAADKGESEAEAAAQGAQSLSGTVFEEESDPTNTYFFGDGTYSETYKGNSLNGSFEINEETDTLTLTPEGASYNYVYSIVRDENGGIIRLTQYEGRNFTIKPADSK